MQSTIALFLIAILATVSAFTLTSRINVPTLNRISAKSSRSALSMADDVEPEFKPEDPKLFDMNRIVRLGRSRDQVNIYLGYCFVMLPNTTITQLISFSRY